MTSFSSIPDALTILKNGGMIIVVDDEDRENELRRSLRAVYLRS